MQDNEYKVQIEQFEGPLDLLLHLINKARIDIEDIFVSKVTGQYLEYISSIPNLPMDKASEFIEMAATLVYIKSRMILPSGSFDDEEQDPQQELIERLRAYKVFKEASAAMKEYEAKAHYVYYKLPEEISFPDDKVELEKMTMQNLFEAYLEVLKRIPDAKPEHIEKVEIHHDIFTIKERTKYIVNTLNELGSATFFSLFADVRTKMEVAVTFIALLELIHENIVLIKQHECYKDIYISKLSEEAVS